MEPANTLPHWTRAPRRDDVLEGVVKRLSTDGHGVFTADATVGPQATARRFRVDAPGGLPGERVSGKVLRRRGDHVVLCEVSILAPAEERVAVRCPHLVAEEHPPCGGCTLQHATPEAQRIWKRDLVSRLLGGAGLGTVPIHETRGIHAPWFYRNRMELTFTPGPNGDGLQLGLYPRGWHHETFALNGCLLLSEPFGPFAQSVADWAIQQGIPAFQPRRAQGFLRNLVVREGKNTGERLVELVTSSDPEVSTATWTSSAPEIAERFAEMVQNASAQLNWPVTHVFWTRHEAVRGKPTTRTSVCLRGSPPFSEILRIGSLPALHFAIDPAAFFQTNTHQAEVLYALVLEAAGLLSPGTEVQRVIDLYCGTGTLAICASHVAREVVGIELNPSSVQDAEQNALRNGRSNIRFIAGDAGAVLEDPDHQPHLFAPDVVIVDPPRAGLLPQALHHVAALAAPVLVYVSCNPVSLARDAANLSASGYRMTDAWPVDMFPHTAHIETVARFERQEAGGHAFAPSEEAGRLQTPA